MRGGGRENVQCVCWEEGADMGAKRSELVLTKADVKKKNGGINNKIEPAFRACARIK